MASLGYTSKNSGYPYSGVLGALAALLVLCCAPSSRAQSWTPSLSDFTITPFVWKGNDAKPNRYPYLVSIRDSSGQHSCGGVLISATAVLTAAHCFKDPRVSRPEVHIGRFCSGTCPSWVQSSDSSFQSRMTVSVDVPGSWDSARYWAGSDIAVITLDRPVDSPKVVAIAGRNSVNLWDRRTLTVVGLGTDETGGLSGTVQEGGLPYRPNPKCNDLFLGSGGTLPPGFGIKPDQLCAGGFDTSACQGDSGGPLLAAGSRWAEDVVVGIVSFGVKCGENTNIPAVFTRVSEYESGFVGRFLAAASTRPQEPIGALPSSVVIQIPQPDDSNYVFRTQAACKGGRTLQVLTNTGEQQCRSQCTGDWQCRAYTHSTTFNSCILYSDCQTTQVAMDALTGFKRAPSTPVVDPFPPSVSTGLPSLTPNGTTPAGQGSLTRPSSQWQICEGEPFAKMTKKTLDDFDGNDFEATCRRICDSTSSCQASVFNENKEHMCRMWRSCGRNVEGSPGDKLYIK